MRPRAPIAALVLLALLGGAAPASAWSVRSVTAPGPASVSALDAPSGGPVSTLLQYRRGSRSTLVLATGTRRTTVATSPGSFEATIGHDARGRPVVAYLTVAHARAARHAYVWSGGRTVALSTGSSSVYGLSLAVAPSGAAVLATSSTGSTIRIFRRAAGAASFAAPQVISDRATFIPRTAITPDGEAVVAWGVRDVRVTRAVAGSAFPAPVSVGIARGELTSLAVTDGGRVLIGARSVLPRPSGGFTRTALLVQWPRGASAPEAAQALSQTGHVGSGVAVLARGERGYLAWRETEADYRGARLGLGIVDADGSLRTRLVRGAGSGSPFNEPAAIAPAGADAARVYIAPFGHAVTARTFFASLHAGDVEHVSPSGERAAGVTATSAGGRAVAAWTTSPQAASSRTSVRIAVAG